MQIEERMKQLERSVRRWRVMGLAALVLVGVVAATAPQKDQSYFVMDSQGNTRAFFGVSPNAKETPQLTMKDVCGNDRLWIGMTDNDEPTIHFYDINRRITSYVDSTGFHRYGAGGGGNPPPNPPVPMWAWPKKGAKCWDQGIWFERPDKAKGDIRKMHLTGCNILDNQLKNGVLKKRKMTKQTIRYAHKHFKDQLEPCSCCIHLFPK